MMTMDSLDIWPVKIAFLLAAGAVCAVTVATALSY
jgi:hypothetical protein